MVNYIIKYNFLFNYLSGCCSWCKDLMEILRDVTLPSVDDGIEAMASILEIQMHYNYSSYYVFKPLFQFNFFNSVF